MSDSNVVHWSQNRTETTFCEQSCV